MPEPREPKLTKQDRKERDRAITRIANEARTKKAEADRRNRRLLIGGIVLGTTAIGLGSAAIFINQPPSQLKSNNEVAARLKDLDTRISRNSNILTDTAPEIAEMAADTLHKETGRPRVDTKKSVEFYDTRKKYADRLTELKTCKMFPTDQTDLAGTINSAEKIIINLQEVLLDPNSPRGIDPEPAAMAYLTLRHELGHLTVLKKPVGPEFSQYMLVTEPLEDYYAEGLTIRKLAANGCYRSITPMNIFEETVVHDQAERAISLLLGYERFQRRGYRDIMQDFNLTVLRPYFPTDSYKLFEIHGQSDPAGFLEEIGKRARLAHPNKQLSNGSLGAQILAPMILKYSK